MSVPILMYHQIATPPSYKTPYRSMTVHPKRFLGQMNWLKRMGYRGVSLCEAMPYIRGEKFGKVAAITFDDSFQNVFDTALPILNSFGFTATNFVVSNEIGGHNRWDQSIGVPPSPCMDLEQLRKWINYGHEIGSHTADHIWLTKVSAQEALIQIKNSKEQLESLLNVSINGFCYPYGNVNADVTEMVALAGYSYATTTAKGKATSMDSVLLLPRVTVRRNDTWMHFFKKCFLF